MFMYVFIFKTSVGSAHAVFIDCKLSLVVKTFLVLLNFFKLLLTALLKKKSRLYLGTVLVSHCKIVVLYYIQLLLENPAKTSLS